MHLLHQENTSKRRKKRPFRGKIPEGGFLEKGEEERNLPKGKNLSIGRGLSSRKRRGGEGEDCRGTVNFLYIDVGIREPEEKPFEGGKRESHKPE